jgi:hypothetical protein
VRVGARCESLGKLTCNRPHDLVVPRTAVTLYKPTPRSVKLGFPLVLENLRQS